MKKMYEYGSKTNKVQISRNETAEIFKAIESSDIEYLSSLKNLSINPNITNSCGDLAVHCAARKGNIEVLKQLMRLQGVKIVSAEDMWEDNPLHIAIYGNRLDVVQFLVNNGADLQAADKYGATPLLRAMQYIAMGSNEMRGIIPEDKAPEGRLEIVKFLLTHSASEDIYPKHLKAIVQSNNVDILEQVLKLGIDPALQDSALREAIIREDRKAIKILLAYGSDIDKISNYAAQKSNKSEIKTLLECATFVDEVCYLLNEGESCGVKPSNAFDLKIICDKLASVDESEKDILSSRVLCRLLGGRSLSVSQVQKSIVKVGSAMSKIYDEVNIDISFLSTKVTALLNDIKAANILGEGEISSLFHKSMEVLKKHNLWAKAIAPKNPGGVSIVPQDIIDIEDGREAAEHKVRACCFTALINLVEKYVGAVNTIGDNVNMYDYYDIEPSI